MSTNITLEIRLFGLAMCAINSTLDRLGVFRLCEGLGKPSDQGGAVDVKEMWLFKCLSDGSRVFMIWL